MLRAVRHILLAVLFVVVATPGAEALDAGTYKFDVGGTIRGVRAADLDGDGLTDLVVLAERTNGDAKTPIEELVILRASKSPTRKTYFDAARAVRVPCNGSLADAGAVAVGRFGPKGETRVRFLGPDGLTDLDAAGKTLERSKRHMTPTLLARSAGQRLVFWDAIADLDGDGRDEIWFPLAKGNGAMRVFAGTPERDRTLTLEPNNQASFSAEYLLVRTAYVPNLRAVDLDGDGALELVALDDRWLVAWSTNGPGSTTAATPPSFRLHLPFLEPDPDLAAFHIRAPRVQLEDVDGDGIADLLVTLVNGRYDTLGSLRTTLFHYPGPIRDPKSKRLVKFRARIDTESVALHPTFLDLDGDGDKEYIGDSIRGTIFDVLRRLGGGTPDIHYVAFRFDKAGTFESTPYFSVKRKYSSRLTLSNDFQRTAWFAGDFDGDGHNDLLDLGDLAGVEVLRGKAKEGASPGEPLDLSTPLLERIKPPGGLTPNAIVEDLNADERCDAVIWGESSLYLIVSKKGA